MEINFVDLNAQYHSIAPEADAAIQRVVAGAEGFSFSPDSLLVTESIASRVIFLPMSPELSRSQIEFACERVREFPAN